jgi:hypothetical protein
LPRSIPLVSQPHRPRPAVNNSFAVPSPPPPTERTRQLLNQKFQLEKLEKQFKDNTKNMNKLRRAQDRNGAVLSTKRAQVVENGRKHETMVATIKQRDYEIDTYREMSERTGMADEEHWMESYVKDEAAERTRRRDDAKDAMRMFQPALHIIANILHEKPGGEIEFKIDEAVSAPSIEFQRWEDDESGLVLDKDGFRLYSNVQNVQFSLPYGALVDWIASPSRGEFGWGETQKGKKKKKKRKEPGCPFIQGAVTGQVTLFFKRKGKEPDYAVVIWSREAMHIHNILCTIYSEEQNRAQVEYKL